MLAALSARVGEKRGAGRPEGAATRPPVLPGLEDCAGSPESPDGGGGAGAAPFPVGRVHVPPKLRAAGLEDGDHWPRCRTGAAGRVRRRRSDVAWRARYTHPHTSTSLTAVCLRGADPARLVAAVREGRVPAPSWTVGGGRSVSVAWAHPPVHVHGRARSAPQDGWWLASTWAAATCGGRIVTGRRAAGGMLRPRYGRRAPTLLRSPLHPGARAGFGTGGTALAVWLSLHVPEGWRPQRREWRAARPTLPPGAALRAVSDSGVLARGYAHRGLGTNG